jgi:hypothetical protein
MAPTTKEQIALAKRRAREQLKALAEIERRTSAPRNPYESHRDRQAAKSREQSRETRDIGELPPVANPKRKEECWLDLRKYCETYFPERFFLAWSDDHIEIIKALETAVLEGGLLAFAMARGSGKTALIEIAALWALSYGHRDFVFIVGCDKDAAVEIIDSIKIACETNDLLLEDFPEIMYPIRALDRVHQRAKGQLYKGKATYIEWNQDEIQLPTIAGSAASGGIIRVKGIEGRIRGQSAARACDGKKIRPSLVLLDDPQTDEVARSPKQVADREAVIQGAILGLAGPDVQISGLAAVTVIQKNDLADRLLDRERHASWHGRRMKTVYEWPTRIDLWEQYAELRRKGMKEARGTAEADAFYLANREAMDAGARVGWPARIKKGEVSAIQNAWNHRIDRGEAAFFAEFQNEPLEEKSITEAILPEHVVKATSPVPQLIIPSELHTLTAFIDVQKTLLYWMVVAWGHKFRGHVVEYGVFPDQGRTYFTHRDARQTLQKAFKVEQDSAAITAGLEELSKQLLERDYGREDRQGSLKIRQLFIDANYSQQRQTVRDFCRRSKWGPRILPTHGRFVGPDTKPIGDRDPRRGERMGTNWMTEMIRRQEHVIFDRNFFFSFVAARLKLPKGDPYGITLHAGQHDLLADHLTSNTPKERPGKIRSMTFWEQIPGREDDWLDCLVGATVAASYCGITAAEVGAAPVFERRVVDTDAIIAEMMR